MVRIPRPTTIQVGGHTLSVNLVSNLSLTEGVRGSCCLQKLALEIDDALPDSLKTMVYFHEVFEAINKIWMAESLNHDDIDRLGEAMTQTLSNMGVEIDWSDSPT